jgi:hypothetical protein
VDLLPEEKDGLKESLDPEEERRLTSDITELYDRLLPSAESDDRRRQLVRKLEKLFNKQWPGHKIKANVFGSSGNKLCSSDSDGTWTEETKALRWCDEKQNETFGADLHVVDICITTDFKDLEHVCLLAEVLAKRKFFSTIAKKLRLTDIALRISQMGWSELSVSPMRKSQL